MPPFRRDLNKSVPFGIIFSEGAGFYAYFGGFGRTPAGVRRGLSAGRNFDLILRSITIGGREAALYFVDGFVKDELLEKIMEHFYKLKPEELTDAAGFESACVPYCEVSLLQEQDDIVTAVLSGMTAAMVDGFGEAIMFDLSTYTQRATAEPDRDKVLRGSRDGFVETMVLSRRACRRRIRDPRLCVEHHSVGRVSHTRHALCYT